jgi:hypothetical protein
VGQICFGGVGQFCIGGDTGTLTELKDTARRKLRSGQKRKSIITACWKQAELW